MSAEGARVPLLVGPVACIGCAPAPVPVWRGPPLTDDVHFHSLVGGGVGATAWSKEWKRPSLARNAGRVVTKPCLADMHVGKIAASSFGIAGLILWTQRVAIEVEATPARVPNGWCAEMGPRRPGTLPPSPPPPASERDAETAGDGGAK